MTSGKVKKNGPASNVPSKVMTLTDAAAHARAAIIAIRTPFFGLRVVVKTAAAPAPGIHDDWANEAKPFDS